MMTTETLREGLTAAIRLIEEAPFAHEKLTEAQMVLLHYRDALPPETGDAVADNKAEMYREMFVAVAEKWGALLERYDLDPDSSPDDVLAAAAGSDLNELGKVIARDWNGRLDAARLARAIEAADQDWPANTADAMAEAIAAAYAAEPPFEKVGDVPVGFPGARKIYDLSDE